MYILTSIVMDKPSTLIPFDRIHMEHSAECSPNRIMSQEIENTNKLEGQQDRNIQAPYHNRYPGRKKTKNVKRN